MNGFTSLCRGATREDHQGAAGPTQGPGAARVGEEGRVDAEDRGLAEASADGGHGAEPAHLT